MLNFSIGLLFFLSGLTSLVYQAIWIRVLSLGVGSTSTSMSLVLSIFFFGLSAGSYLAGKWIHRIKKPVLFYGIIEAIIGAYAIGLIYVLINFHTILGVLPITGLTSWFGIFCKFTLVFIALLLPTVCMGASLPLLIRFFVKKDQSVGRLVSLLYGINTLGAVVGAFFAGFYFIPQFGILLANHSMATVNILILVGAIVLQRRLGTISQSKSEDKDQSKELSANHLKVSSFSPWQKIVLLSCGVAGMSSIAAEVVWNKYLGIFLGSNIYGLSLILSLFLLGIAVGSLVLSLFVDKIKNLVNLYVAFLFMACAMMLGASYLLNLAPIFANIISYYAGPNVSLLTIKSLLTGIILFLPTCFFGALLPLAIRLLTDKAQMAASVTGFAYAINTVGSILGAYISGIILIPLVGSHQTIHFAVLSLAVMGLVVSWEGLKNRRMRFAYIALYPLLFIVSFSTDGISFRNIIKSAYYQATPEDLNLSQVMRYFTRDSEDFKLIVEGRTAIISLSQSSEEGGDEWKRYLRLKTNGLNESLYDLKNLSYLPKYEVMLGLLPYSMSQNPKNAFIVGYGGGSTVDFLSAIGLQSVYVSELEQGIIDASQYVHKGKNPILQRPNVKLEIEDARFVLAAKLDGPYDIIVSQPSHSWLAGVANLFTHEYFQIVSNNLTERGVFSQWLNLYNMDQEVLFSILHTFFTTFPYGAVFTDPGDQQMIMIGAHHPVQFNMDKLHAIFLESSMNNRMIEFNSPYDIVSTFLMDREEALRLSQSAQLNTDINAFAEVRQSRLFYSYVENPPSEILAQNYQANFSSIFPEATVKDIDFNLNILRSLQSAAERTKHIQKFYVALKKFYENMSEDMGAAYKLAEFLKYIERYQSAQSLLEKSLQENPTSQALDLLIRTHLSTKSYSEALNAYNKYPQLRRMSTDCYAIGLFTNLGKWDQAHVLVRKVLGQHEKYYEVCGAYLAQFLGQYYYYNNMYQEATTYLEQYYSNNPYDLSNLELLMATYFSSSMAGSASMYIPYYQDLYEQEKNRLNQLVAFFEAEGLFSDATLIRNKLDRLSR